MSPNYSDEPVCSSPFKAEVRRGMAFGRNKREHDPHPSTPLGGEGSSKYEFMGRAQTIHTRPHKATPC